jgi:hypothetical protein
MICRRTTGTYTITLVFCSGYVHVHVYEHVHVGFCVFPPVTSGIINPKPPEFHTFLGCVARLPLGGVIC